MALDIRAFGSALAAALRETHGMAYALNPDEDALTFTDGSLSGRVGLQAFYAMFLGGRPVSDIAALVAEIHRGQGPLEHLGAIQEQLLCHLVPERMDPDGALMRTAAPGLKEALAVDHPAYVRMLTPHDLVSLDETADAMWARAEMNMRRRAVPEESEEIAGEHWFSFRSADDAWFFARRQEHAAVAVPAPHVGVVIGGSPDSETLGALAAWAAHTFCQERAHVLSPAVYLFSGGHLAGVAFGEGAA